MGCDIHLYYEKFDGEKWVCPEIKDIDPGRNYILFSVLADVRNGVGITPISKPRDLPKDVSASLKQYLEEAYHSRSWLLLSEIEAYDWEQLYNRTLKEHCIDFWNYTVPFLRSLGEPDKVRIVFGFDN